MTNYRSDRQAKLDINLDKVCIASRYYRVKQLVRQLGESEDLGSETDLEVHLGSEATLEIGWQEQVTLHYLITPLEPDEVAYTLSECRIAKNSLIYSPLTNTNSLVTDFVCLEHSHEHFLVSFSLHCMLSLT